MDIQLTEEIERLLNLDFDKLPEHEKDEVTERLKEIKSMLSGIYDINTDDTRNLLFMWTPMQKHYLTKLLTTSLIAFLNRMCDEWKVPEGVPVTSIYEYADNPDSIKPAEYIKDKEILKRYEENAEWMKKRLIVKSFLEDMFKFDPHDHAKPSYVPNLKDEERTPLMGPSARLAVYYDDMKNQKNPNLSTKQKEESTENKEKYDMVEEKEEEHYKIRYKTIMGKNGQEMLVKQKIRCSKEEWEEIKRKKTMHYRDDMKTDPDMVKFKRLHDVSLKETVRDMLPPRDFFHRFAYYMDSNYEELLKATKDIYAEKPDIDYCINPLEVCTNEEETDKFIRDNQGVPWNINNVKMGKWSVLGPYKENRKRIELYGSNSSILQKMFDSIEEDQKLGKQLMKNRIKRNKKKNKLSKKDLTKMRSVTNNTPLGNDSDDDSDDEIEVPVVRISQGGKVMDKTSFKTTYNVSM